MLIEIGANKIKANAIHFFNNNIIPIIISKTPKTGNIYPVAFNELINSPAEPVGASIGIKANNLLAPKTKRASPKAILIMVVNMEFIGGSFELVIW
jgi:hypothetical protein